MRRALIFIAAVVAAVGCTRELPTETAVAPAVDPFVPGVAEVLLSSSSSAAFETKASASVFEDLGVVSLERIFPDAGEFEARHREAGLDRWYRVVYDKTVSGTKASESLSALPGVESVNLPRRKKTSGEPFFNDPHFNWQWNLYNDGTSGKRFTAGADINVVPVWKEFTCGKPEVVVAVIDGGIDMSHEDLAGVVLRQGPGGSMSTISDVPDVIPSDHGTHVAGIIGAINGNAKGVAGVAGGKGGKGGVTLMSCQIFTDDNKYGNSAEAIVWAADNGAVIANNSWGYVYDSESHARQDVTWFRNNDSPDKAAIDYFVKNAGCDASGKQTGPMKGGVVIFAAGNDGWKYAVPASYDKVIAVGSFDPDYTVSAYSNYGDWVDICAPGGADDEDFETWPYIYSTVPAPDIYAYMSGTSMAAPHVTGVAALLVSYYGGPGFTAAQLTERLLSGARQGLVGTSTKKIGGVLDAYGAITFKGGSFSPVQITTNYTGDYTLKSHETLKVDFSITGNDDGKYKIEFDSSSPAASAEVSKDKVKMTINALKDEPGVYTAKIYAGRGTESENSYSITFEILENGSPYMVDVLPDVILDADASGMSIALDRYFKDPDGEILKYAVSSDGGVGCDVSGQTLNLRPDEYGMSTVTVRASDARAKFCEQSFRALVRDCSKAVDVYPIPATDVLYVRPATEVSVDARFVSKAGAEVLHYIGKAGPFKPMSINIASLPAGSYSLKLLCGSETTVTTVVKY